MKFHILNSKLIVLFCSHQLHLSWLLESRTVVSRMEASALLPAGIESLLQSEHVLTLSNREGCTVRGQHESITVPSGL